MTAETQSLFELIRREGLIVIAIAALAWQVYWLTTASQGQDQFWRDEMMKYREQIAATELERQKARVEYIAALQELKDEIGVVLKIVADFEEECQIFQVRQETAPSKR